MSQLNRQWVLASRPSGKVCPDNFEYRELAQASRELNDNEILVRNVVFLCAPTMRNWIDPPGNSLYPSIPIGAPIMAPAVGRVISSKIDGIESGARVFGLSSWQDHAIMTANAMRRPTLLPDGITFLEGIGRYGLNPMTAYFGLLDVGKPNAGETLVVSGAAGSTGSTVAQIGKIKGLKVVGIAGGSSKCEWLTRDCGIDAAIDYRSENVTERLNTLCPQGIDVFFDNVGGEILQAAVDNMAPFGRIVLCGQISSYDNDGAAVGPHNMMRLIYGSIRMQGFLAGSYAARFGEAVAALRQWHEAGRIVYREDLHHGFDKLPTAFTTLFDGSNTGTLLVQVDDSAAEIA